MSVSPKKGAAPGKESGPLKLSNTANIASLSTGGLVERIHARFPGVREMFSHLGIEVPDRDGKKFASPFRPDNSPSCTIKGDLLYDWSRDGKGVDAIGVYALSKGITNAEAIKALAGHDAPVAQRTAPKTLEATKPAKPPFRKLEEATDADLQALAKLRKIYSGSLLKAVKAGHLFFADTAEGRAFVVTDTSRRVCQSRRLDGKPWSLISSKAWTSIKQFGFAGWPLGTAEIGDREKVVLCEGGPDWLVAHEAEPLVATCTMLGAKQAIHEEALPFFQGKSVRILAHGDEAGTEACRNWATQLTKAGATVTAIRIDFGKAKDLNDCVHLSAEEWRKFNIANLLP